MCNTINTRHQTTHVTEPGVPTGYLNTREASPSVNVCQTLSNQNSPSSAFAAADVAAATPDDAVLDHVSG